MKTLVFGLAALAALCVANQADAFGGRVVSRQRVVVRQQRVVAAPVVVAAPIVAAPVYAAPAAVVAPVAVPGCQSFFVK